MNPPRHVRKRDGRVVPFDEGKIADAIYRAALAVGGEDRFLAEELASMVTLFLVKGMGPAAEGPAAAPLPGIEGVADAEPAVAVPGIEQIQDVVERVLIETGHARTARAYILHREKRSRLRAAAAARRAAAEPTLFDDRRILIEDPSTERAQPFSRDRLARAVAAEADLEHVEALAVTAEVEARLRRAGMGRLPAPLLSSLVDAVLLERGHLCDPRRRSGVALSRATVETALAPRGRPGATLPPEDAARRLGGEALRAHALADVLPPLVASAHLDGSLHVHGLHRPAALFAATLSLEALKEEGVPGSPSRAPGRAATDLRRMVAQTGRAVRGVSDYVTGGLAVPAANLFLASLVPGGPDGDPPAPADLREDAWHLLLEASRTPGDPSVDLELLADVPPWAAPLPSRGAGGRRNGETLAAAGGAALALARAILAERASADGLPPRGCLPTLTLVVGRGGIGDPRSRELLREALAAVVAGSPLRIIPDRGGVPGAGPPGARETLPRGVPGDDPALLRPFEVQRVALNLPRAAFRNLSGDLTGFFRECDRLVDLAVEAHLARRSLLAGVAVREGGALAPLFRRGGARRRATGDGGLPPPDLAEGVYSVAVAGLNEAVAHLLGEELHESDAAVKVGMRTLAYLALRTREAGEKAALPLRLDAGEERRALARFLEADTAEHGDDLRRVAGGRPYTPGVSLRPDAPADLLRRLEREGRLHSHVRNASFRYDPSAERGVSEEGLLALLEKTFLHTEVRALALGGTCP